MQQEEAPTGAGELDDVVLEGAAEPSTADLRTSRRLAHDRRVWSREVDAMLDEAVAVARIVDPAERERATERGRRTNVARRAGRHHAVALRRVRHRAATVAPARPPARASVLGRGSSGRPRARSRRTAAATSTAGGDEPGSGRGSSDDGPAQPPWTAGPDPVARRVGASWARWWLRWRRKMLPYPGVVPGPQAAVLGVAS